MRAPERTRPARPLRRTLPRGLAVTGCIGLALAALPASGFGLGGLFGGGGVGNIVYDPSNHLETAAIAAESVRQTALQVSAEVQRLQQLAIELRQVRALSPDAVRAVLADWSSQLAALDETGRTLLGVGDQLAATRQRSAAQLRQIVALGVSPQAWLQREIESSGQRRQSAELLLVAERHSLEDLTRTRQALARLQAQIPASSGIQQSMQTTNQYLDLLAGQSSQLLQLGAAQAAAQARQHSAIEADAAQADAREAQRTAADLQAIAELRAQLRQREASEGWGVLRPLSAPVP
ncbi:MAG: hypothetical protein KGI67_05065 [Pseudomonadota bacterium]|nr:hypothetical protein [Pseudomonadota bacterium]